MADIILTTFNARHQHSAFGLRYLLANLRELQSRTNLYELTLNDDPDIAARHILDCKPRIVGIGVYIWNAELSHHLVCALRQRDPEVVIVVGGPEVSHEYHEQEITQWADYVVTGEGDRVFPDLCRAILDGLGPSEKVLHGGAPDLRAVELPYHLYSDSDIAHRVVYVEASRGCPFSCEFCLSALDRGVRRFEMDRFLDAMEDLLARGARRFKFVDRTFNLAPKMSLGILDFFLDRYTPELFLHFEMIPDQLPEVLKTRIAEFPAGALQFEVGIQTFNPEVMTLISRRQHIQKVEENLRSLREETGVHVHADLIAGLPGEDLESFGQGFDHLWSLGPQEIQVGILKRLRGTPIIRHTEPFALTFNPQPPYDILSTAHMPRVILNRIKRFAHYWDRVANSGRFRQTLPLLLENRPFENFLAFSDHVFDSTGLTHSIALEHWVSILFEYLSPKLGPRSAAQSLAADYTRDAPRRLPRFLKEYVTGDLDRAPHAPPSHLPSRQARHLA